MEGLGMGWVGWTGRSGPQFTFPTRISMCSIAIVFFSPCFQLASVRCNARFSVRFTVSRTKPAESDKKVWVRMTRVVIRSRVQCTGSLWAGLWVHLQGSLAILQRSLEQGPQFATRTFDLR
jgi:hypothetical protein